CVCVCVCLCVCVCVCLVECRLFVCVSVSLSFCLSFTPPDSPSAVPVSCFFVKHISDLGHLCSQSSLTHTHTHTHPSLTRQRGQIHSPLGMSGRGGLRQCR